MTRTRAVPTSAPVGAGLRRFLVLAVAFAWLAIACDVPRESTAFKGGPAPAFEITAFNKEFADRAFSLEQLRGQIIVLNFWASWCEPCQRETPALVAFSKANPGLDVVGLAVNDRPADSRRFAAQMKIPYDLGADRDADVASEFGVQGLPVTVIIDAEGRIADTFAGEITRAQLDGYAAQLLP